MVRTQPSSGIRFFIKRNLADTSTKEIYDTLLVRNFKEDYLQGETTSGELLITKVKKIQPHLKIIVFSVEDKPFRIQNLYNNLKIQGYVWKNRNGLKELKKAIYNAFNGGDFYISPELKSAIHPKKAIEITDSDIFLIKSLSKGLLQEEISKKLKEKGITPSSVSAIEKRLKFLISYPHGCIEQTTSSVFPQLYLSKVMDLDNARKMQIDRNRGIDHLASVQRMKKKTNQTVDGQKIRSFLHSLYFFTQSPF